MMTKTTTGTPPEILAALQAAWGQTIATPAKSPEQIIVPLKPQAAPIATEPPKARRICPSHIQPFDAIETPAPRRPGWIRVTCRRCGRFIGFHPESPQ